MTRHPMGMKARDRNARRVQEEIRTVLMECWDPIGVQGIPEAADEYDSYIGGVYRLLASQATVGEIAKHLWDIEVYQMGLASKPGGLERIEPVAHKLREVDISLENRVDYSGTVNERLYSAGLMDDFDAAARRRDREAMIALLIETDLPRESAEWSVDTLLRDPAKYGYPEHE